MTFIFNFHVQVIITGLMEGFYKQSDEPLGSITWGNFFTKWELVVAFQWTPCTMEAVIFISELQTDFYSMSVFCMYTSIYSVSDETWICNTAIILTSSSPMERLKWNNSSSCRNLTKHEVHRNKWKVWKGERKIPVSRKWWLQMFELLHVLLICCGQEQIILHTDTRTTSVYS